MDGMSNSGMSGSALSGPGPHQMSAMLGGLSMTGSDNQAMAKSQMG